MEGQHLGKGLKRIIEENNCLKSFLGETRSPFDTSGEEYESLLKQVSSEEYHRNKFEKIKDDPNRIYYDKKLRQELYERGVEIPTEEMSREFYLENRIRLIEFENLVNVFETFERLKAKKKFSYSWGLIGVGTSVYSDDYFLGLEKYFLEQGFSRNDYIVEKTIDCYDECKDMNYEEYEAYCKNRSPAIDEQWDPVSREKYEEWKNGDQKDYIVKKRVGEILDNKGEDLDFVFLRDDESIGSEYNRERTLKFSEIFYNSLCEKGFDIKKEESFLTGADYSFLGGEELCRYKSISGKNGTIVSYRINFDEGRNLHFYLRNDQADLKLKREMIENFPFSLLVRRSNYYDLMSAFEHGQKTGIYENPEMLKWKGQK